MENIAINVDKVSKSFKNDNQSRIFNRKINQKLKSKLFSLQEISFTVKRGEILGLIGLNGSGKTTLLRIIAGVYPPDTGNVTINGKLSPLLHIGTGFEGDLNAKENIIMNGMLLGISKSEILKRVESIIKYAELENFLNLKLKYFSAGMRARLAFSTAMQINPDILLVDEIMSVGDKNFRKKSYETFLSFKKNQKTIVHVTHNLERLAEFSDKVLLLHKGKMVMLGKPEEVINRYHEIKPSNQL